MRVAVFSSTIDVRNGYGNITYEYCNALYRKGIDFTLFLPKFEIECVEKLGVNFPVSCILPEYIYRVYSRSFLQYLRIVNVVDFDLVHSLFSFPYCLMAARSAKKYDVPFLMGAQGTYGVLPLTWWPDKLFLKWSYKQARQVIVPSEFTKEYIKKYARMTYPISVIHNGVNFNRFQARIDDRILDKARRKGKRVLLTIGGLKVRKGQDLVIQALPKIIKKFPNIIYVLVGEGSTKNSLLQLAKDLKVEAYVDFVGSKIEDELVAYFKTCDVYVHTPRVVDFNFEGFGIVYLEAGACRKPVVATDAGGIRDAVMHEKTGLIVGDGDVDSVAEAVCHILSDENFARNLGDAGFEYAKQHDWQDISQKFIQLYELYVGE